MRSICFLLQKPSKKKKKAHILFLLLQATESALNEDTQWCPFSVKACESRPTEGCIVEMFYVLGRKRRVAITEAVSWDSALLAGPRSQVPLGFEGAEERGGGRRVGWGWGGGGGSFGSMGLFVAAAHLNACHSPCRPVWQRWVTRRCNSAPLPHKYTWHIFWRSTSADLEFLFLFFLFSFPICKRNVVVFQISLNCVFFYSFIYMIYLLNMWVLREDANDQTLSAVVDVF